jgi:hypothetical protein
LLEYEICPEADDELNFEEKVCKELNEMMILDIKPDDLRGLRNCEVRLMVMESGVELGLSMI